jgi:tetratricopeptide (TPR) repeat protein
MRLLKEIRNLMGSYHVKSGIYHFYRNEFKQAVDFFTKALKDEPAMGESDRRTARYFLTQTFIHSAEKLASSGDLLGAARDYVRATEVSPEFPDIRFNLGKTYEALHRVDDAIEQYRLAIASNPGYDHARTALAFCLLRAGRDHEAVEAFAAVLQLRMRRLSEPYDKGVQRLREGVALEAEEFFREAFLAAPNKFEGHYRSALALLKSEQFEKALVELDQAIALGATYGDLHNFRGVALCELGRLDDGIAAFRRAVGLNAGHQVAKLNLAFALLRAGQFKDAEHVLEDVLESDPSQSVASAKLQELRTGRIADTRRPAGRGATR